MNRDGGKVKSESDDFLSIKKNSSNHDSSPKATDGARELAPEVYRALFDSAEDGVLLMKRDVVIDCNPRLLEIYKLTREEAIGSTPLDYSPILQIDGSLSEELSQARIDAALAGETQLFEWINVNGLGEPLWVEVMLKRLEADEDQLVFAVIRDVTKRKFEEEKERARARAVRERHAVIVELGKDERLIQGDLVGFAKRLCEAAAEAIEVDRVGLWTLKDEGRVLECMNMYERSPKKHSSGQSIDAGEYPSYFQALETGRAIQADNAPLDPRFCELKDSYLIPNDIKSMMDAPIRISGKVVGVVCHESVGKPIKWHGDEIAFAGEIADLAAIAMINEDRMRAEEALRASEEKYRLLFDASPESITLVGLDGRIMDMNPANDDLLGYNQSNTVGRPFMDLESIDPAELPRFIDVFQRLVKGEKVEPIELKTVDAKGNPRWIESYPSPLKRGGEVYAILVVSREVTERRNAEEAIRRSEIEYRATIDAMRDMIHVVDQDLKIILANASILRALSEFGYSTDVEGKTPFDLFPFLDDTVRREYEEVFRDGKALVTAESFIIGGKEKFSETIKIPIHDGFMVKRVLTVIRDVTEKKMAEKALVRSEAKYRELVENANSIILRMDPEGKVTFFNEFAQRFFGFSEEEILGRNVVGTIVPETDVTGRDLRIMVQDIGRNTDLYRTNENENVKRDGERVWVAWTNKAVCDADGNIVEILCIGNDITSRKRAEEERVRLEHQLQQARKLQAVGQLAGGVAHDFNNLLTPILGYSEMILANLKNDDAAAEGIKEIREAAFRARDLTRQLLAVSRKQVIQMKVINLSRVITGMEKMLTRTIRENVEIKIEIETDLKNVKADLSQIEQIILNLAVNAQDSMPDGGTMWIKAGNDFISRDRREEFQDLRPGNYAVISVIDTGVGMDEETRERVFEPFFTTKDMGKGTGLGLATVYGVVKQHQGHAFVASEPGKGSTFKIYLPAVDQEAHSGMEEGSPSAERGSAERIMVVEDNEQVRELTREILEHYGYEVICAADAEDCMKKLGRERRGIDVLLTDVIMPRMSGRVLYEKLSPQMPGLKVIYMSGYADNELAHHGVADGKTNFIQKPFSVDDLINMVRETLKE